MISDLRGNSMNMQKKVNSIQLLRQSQGKQLI